MNWCVDRTRIRGRWRGDQHGRAFGQNVHVASGRGGNLQSDPRRSHGVPRVRPERRRGADRHGRRPACCQSVCSQTRRPVRYLNIKSKLWTSSWCDAALSFTWDVSKQTNCPIRTEIYRTLQFSTSSWLGTNREISFPYLINPQRETHRKLLTELHKKSSYPLLHCSIIRPQNLSDHNNWNVFYKHFTES